jgi:hypothetical protein
MSGLPYAKFYPCDWMSDPAVRVCSLAAQGLWINLLCMMFQTGGYLSMVATDSEQKTIAKLTGNRQETIRKLLSELEIAGVFSRTETGTIYSRRIVRDVAKAQQDQENGRKGGNPTLVKGVNPQVNPTLNPPIKPQVNGGDKVARANPESSSEDRTLGSAQRVLSDQKTTTRGAADGEIVRGPWRPTISLDDDKTTTLARQERQVRTLYGQAEAERILAYSLGANVRDRSGYLGSFIAKAESEHPPPPKPDKAERERERLRQEARALGLNV